LINGRTKSTYITQIITPEPKQVENRSNKRVAKGKEENILALLTEFNPARFFELATAGSYGETARDGMAEINSYTLYIAEDRRHNCPKLLIQILGQDIYALIDTGCELTIMNEHLYHKLRHEGLESYELPTQHVNLIGAFSKKSNRVRKQSMLEAEVGDHKITQIVLLSPQLLTDVILGLDFLVEYKAIINFRDRKIILKFGEELTELQFTGARRTTDDRKDVEESSEEKYCSKGFASELSKRLLFDACECRIVPRSISN
jgi:hypothetical protein